jgi:hypothetical protein
MERKATCPFPPDFCIPPVLGTPISPEPPPSGRSSAVQLIDCRGASIVKRICNSGLAYCLKTSADAQEREE